MTMFESYVKLWEIEVHFVKTEKHLVTLQEFILTKHNHNMLKGRKSVIAQRVHNNSLRKVFWLSGKTYLSDDGEHLMKVLFATFATMLLLLDYQFHHYHSYSSKLPQQWTLFTMEASKMVTPLPRCSLNITATCTSLIKLYLVLWTSLLQHYCRITGFKNVEKSQNLLALLNLVSLVGGVQNNLTSMLLLNNLFTVL